MGRGVSLETAGKAYQLTLLLHDLTKPAVRTQLIDDPQALYGEYRIAPGEQTLIDSRDWLGLIHAGAIFFGPEKLAAVLGDSNVDIYAQFRGETLEEFQASRNASLRYSTSGVDMPDPSGDR